MKIAYIHHSLVTSGGVERMIAIKTAYLVSKGHEAIIITTDQNSIPPVYPLDPRVQFVDLGINFYTKYRYPRFVREMKQIKLRRLYLHKLSEVLNAFRPDVTICPTYDFFSLSPAIDDGSVKIVESHIAKKFTKDDPQHPLIQYFLSFCIPLAIQRFVNKRGYLVSLTQNDAQSWGSVKRKAVIPNFLPFYPDQTSACVNKRLIAVGRLESQKGFDLLIDAWFLISKSNPEWSVHIYGKGREQAALQDKIDRLGLSESVKIHEPVVDIVKQFTESAFYVMSSRYEGFGMTLIEAMACGLPVVSFDCPEGPAEIIRNGEDGFLVKNGDTSALAERMHFLIHHTNERIDMGRKARGNVVRYLPENIMPRWIELFESAILKE
ncbi:MAG: glycosyltransferase family 4 protein [Bacteroidales bacterium]|nr:glycosyltransferase family 4 protein [Bacteroidales bacterium]